jgi:hypothetical protein
MSDFKAGDRVRVKVRPDWPLPSGYRLANLKGHVYDVIDEPEGYVLVLLDKEDATGLDSRVPLGFQASALEKI